MRDGGLGKAYADDEIEHHSHAGEEHTARHALAIEHEEKGEIDQCRPRLTLHHDAEHGGEDDGQGDEEVLRAVDVVTIFAHELGQSQCRGKLGKLGWLQAQGAQHQPRPRPFDGVRVEDGGKDQQQQEGIEDIGKGVVEAVVEQQQDGAEHERGGYPYNLHARACRQGEDVCVAVGVTGTAHADPSEREQGHVNEYGPPVDRPEHTVFLICLLCHS